MRDLYEYMVMVRKQMYDTGKVEIDTEHFFRLYQLVCHMIQIAGIVHLDEDMAVMYEQIRSAKDG